MNPARSKDNAFLLVNHTLEQFNIIINAQMCPLPGTVAAKGF